MKKEIGNYIEMSYNDMKNRSLDYCLTPYLLTYLLTYSMEPSPS